MASVVLALLRYEDEGYSKKEGRMEGRKWEMQ